MYTVGGGTPQNSVTVGGEGNFATRGTTLLRAIIEIPVVQNYEQNYNSLSCVEYVPGLSRVSAECNLGAGGTTRYVSIANADEIRGLVSCIVQTRDARSYRDVELDGRILRQIIVYKACQDTGGVRAVCNDTVA